MKSYLAQGFTLVELLVVIGLLSLIAVIVVAVINPIEQFNKARDTQYQADATQIVAAEDRYYASYSKYPWTTVLTANMGFVSAFDLTAATTPGICGTGGCPATGTLVALDELKTGIVTRPWAASSAAFVDQIFVGRAAGVSTNVYACFAPKSKSFRQKLIDSSSVKSAASFSGGGPANGTCTLITDAAWVPTSVATATCVSCVPQ